MTDTHPITDFRTRTGATQHEIARAVGSTRWTINRIECGGRRPSITLAKKLARHIGVELHDIRPDLSMEAAE